MPCKPPILDGLAGVFRMGSVSTYANKLLLSLCRVDTSRPERPFFNEANSGLLDCKVFLSVSEDDGANWTTPRLLDTSPYDKQPTPTTGPALILPDGRIAIQFELNLPYESTAPWRHLPVLKFSSNMGKTFDYHAIPAEDPENKIFYWDQRPIVLRDGKIVNFFWTWDNSKNCYHNITMTSSDDGGRTWTAPHDTGIPGQAGPGVELADGRLLIPIVDRTGNPKVVAHISADRGLSFTDKALLLSGNITDKQTASQDDMSGAWREMSAFSVGLPAAVDSGHGTVYVVWYEGIASDKTHIEFAEIQV